MEQIGLGRVKLKSYIKIVKPYRPCDNRSLTGTISFGKFCPGLIQVGNFLLAGVASVSYSYATVS